MEKLFMNICMDLWSYDAPITYELFISTVKEYIKNLESHIGEEAHKKLKELGVIDNTGMTWEEQDAQTGKQIKEYKDLLDYLQDDSNWTY